MHLMLDKTAWTSDLLRRLDSNFSCYYRKSSLKLQCSQRYPAYEFSHTEKKYGSILYVKRENEAAVLIFQAAWSNE